MQAKTTLLAALALLDAAVDTDWTADGLPRLDRVAELLGDGAKVTREELAAAAPGFARGKDLPEAGPAPEEPPAPSAERTPEAVSAELGAALQASRDAAQRVVDLQNELGRMQSPDAGTPVENPIPGYLQAQRAVLAQRAEVRAALKDQAVNLGELQRSLRAPIDAAFARRTARGTQRPAFGLRRP